MIARFWLREDLIILWAAGAVLIAATLGPLIWPAVDLLGSSDAARQAAGPLGSIRTWTLLLRSLALAGAVTAAALLIGVPLGVVVARAGVPGRLAILIAHGFPFLLPPFLLGLGWFHLLGRQGFAGGESTALLLFGEAGLVWVLALAFAPVATSLVALSLSAMDPSLEEAARVVAPPWRVARGILLPAARPAVTLAAIVIFTLSFSELGVPMFLRVDVYQAAVFARLGGVYSPAEAFVLALPMLPVAFVLLGVERWLLRGRSFAVVGLRGERRAPMPLGRWRVPVTAACWIGAAISLAPIAALAARGARDRGYQEMLGWIGPGLMNSLIPAFYASSIVVLLGIIVGHALARRRRGAAILDGAATLAFLTPAAVLGVGLITVWNRPATQLVYGGPGIIAAGYVARYAVIGLRTVASSIAQGSPHLEEAAAAHGGAYLRRLVLILLPVHWRGVAAAWLLTFVFCLRDLETAVLYYPPGGEPLTVRIMTLEANGPEQVVAALGVAHAGVTAAILVGALLLLGRRRRS